MNRRSLLRALGTLPLAYGFPPAANASPPALRLGILPFNSTLALLKTHQPLRLHLQARLGRPVELFTSPDYFTFLNDSLAGQYDLLITGPHFGVMSLGNGYEPLFRYRAVLEPIVVIAANSPIAGLHDLRGRRIALSSRLSISSIGGVKWLQDQGLQVDRDYQLVERSTHGAAVASVAVGEVDAALTTHTPLRQIPEDVRSRVRLLPLTLEVPHLMTLAHRRLGPRLIAEIRAALAGFPFTPEGRTFFSDTGYLGYEPVSAADLKALLPFVELTRRMLGHTQ